MSEVSAQRISSDGANLKRAARGAFIETAGYVLSLALRFGSNLILTRLLVPEVFGLLAMVMLVQYSLFMLADVGLNQAVIASPKGDDEDYLNTVWSLQIIRGFVLTAAMLLATWPAALWFKEPRMLWIVPFVTLNTFVHGFISSRVFTCARHVNVTPLLKLELVTQVIGLAINIAGAYHGYGLLSLLIGQFVSSVIYTVASHFLPVNNHRDRWNMDPALRKEILGFGRWIFFSSALTVVAGRGDSAMLGRLLGPASLGLYNLAANIADLPESLGGRLMNTVIYPTLATTFKDAPQNFSKMFYRLRFYFDAATHSALGLLAAMSEWIITFLYPDRYQGAGTMLSVFAFRTSVGLLAAPWESAFFARGHTHFGFRRSLITSISVLVAMPLGYYWFGGVGVLWATVVARGTALLVLWPAAHMEGLIRYHRELLVPLFLLLGFVLGSLLVSGLTAWLPGLSITSILQSLNQR